MKEFEPLIGEWHGEGEFPIEPPLKMSVEAKVQRLGEFIVLQLGGRARRAARQHLDHRRRTRWRTAADALLR